MDGEKERDMLVIIINTLLILNYRHNMQILPPFAKK